LQSEIVGLGKSLELRPTDPWSREALAACYVALGKAGDAITILEERLKSGPIAVFPVVGLGMALLASGDYARAEAKFRQGISMDGEYSLAWFGFGKALVAQKQFKPAEDAFRRTLELAPSMSEARLNLADLLIERGQLEEATLVCCAALHDTPDMADFYLKMAKIRSKQRRYEESLEYCEMARRAAPYTHPAKVLLAVNCFQNGDRETAQKLLHEASSESPDHPVAALMLGQLARGEGQGEAARKYLAAAALHSIPENWPESHKQRFLVLLHSERLQLAEQLQDVALARDSISKWLQVDPQNRQLRKMYDELRANPAP
jgi:tetratricopeptide (TPR) repeat protein